MYPGTFPPVTIRDFAALPPTASVVIQSQTRNKADVIISSDKASTITLNAAKRITFRDVTLQYIGNAEDAAVISIEGNTENIRIENCNLIMNASGAEQYLIKTRSGDKGTQLTGLYVHNSLFDQGGIRLDDLTPESVSSEVEIKSNAIENFYGYAVYMRNARNVTITDNNISSSNPSNGISLVQAHDQVNMEMNRINLDNGAEAINIECGPSSSTTVSLVNNFIDQQCSSASVGGITLTRVGGHVLHNTVRLLPYAGKQVSYGAAILKNYGSSVNIRSNILYSTIPGISATLISQAENSSQDFNNIYVPDGYVGTDAGERTTTYKTLEEWRYFTGFDLNSTDEEPVFMGESDLHLAYDQPFLRPDGIPKPHLATDIDGDQRIFPPCTGADEFTETQGKPSAQSSRLALSVYPNPVEAEKLTVSGEVRVQGTWSISIVDVYGVPYHKQKIYVDSNKLSNEVILQDIPPGMYILQLTDPYAETWVTRFERR